jgi:hypothetical protein
MHYPSGEDPRAGDQVALDGGHGPRGVVVVVIGHPEGVRGYPAEEWEYLGKGLMVEVEGMGLVHYEEPNDDDLVLVRRGA